MIKILTLLALLLPVPLAAQTIDQMLGRWAGEGIAVSNEEPGVRFSCRVRLSPEGSGTALFAGRCATTQGQQSFAYLVIERGDGSVSAQNRSQPPDSLPQRLSGSASAGLVRLQGGANQMFELSLVEGQLRFRIEGGSADHPTQGEAFLNRRD